MDDGGTEEQTEGQKERGGKGWKLKYYVLLPGSQTNKQTRHIHAPFW